HRDREALRGAQAADARAHEPGRPPRLRRARRLFAGDPRRYRRLDTPNSAKRATLAVNRVGLRQRNMRDAHERLGMLGLAAAAEVIAAVRRIGTNDHEVQSLPDTLMAGASPHHRNVAGAKLDLAAARAAEAYDRAAARDAEHLVGRGMIVDIRKDAVAPHFAPAIAREHRLNHILSIGRAGTVHSIAIHESTH